MLRVDLPDGRIVARFSADQKIGERGGLRLTGKELLQDRWRELEPNRHHGRVA